MNEVEKAANEHYLNRPEGFGSPIDDFLAGAAWQRERDVEICQKYAERNRTGEDDEKMGWVSAYHRIAGENLRDEIAGAQQGHS